MYSSKIKDLIKRASRKSIGAIPVGLKVSFGGAKMHVEAQYEISGNVVINIVGENRNNIAKIDGSVKGKSLAKDMLYNYVINNTIGKKYYTSTEGPYNHTTRKRERIQTEIDIAKRDRIFKRNTSNFIDELYREVKAANKKTTSKPVKNKVARKAAPKKTVKKTVTKRTVTKRKAAKKVTTKKTNAPKKAPKKSSANLYQYRYDKKTGNLVYAGSTPQK